MQHAHIFKPPRPPPRSLLIQVLIAPTVGAFDLKETCYSLNNLTWIAGDRGVWGYMLHYKQVLYKYLLFYKKKFWVTSHFKLKFEFVSNPSVFGSFYHCKKMFSYTQTYNNNEKYRVKMSSIIFVRKKIKMLS